MNEFKHYHPIVNFAYFIVVILFSCIIMHPVCLGISFFCAAVYSVMLIGRRALKVISGMLPLMIVTAAVNPAFNHEGATIIGYFPSGNPLTAESVFYGLSTAVMLASVIFWFMCYNEIITGDKTVWLFGRLAPSLSLVLSMTMRFVPRFVLQLKKVSDAKRCLSGKEKSLLGKVRRAASVLSITLTWALENAVDTADSMKARGYGIGKRSAFSVFKIEKRDVVALSVIFISTICVTVGKISGKIAFDYFPKIVSTEMTTGTVSVFIFYLVLCACPIVVEIREVIRWKRLGLKM